MLLREASDEPTYDIGDEHLLLGRLAYELIGFEDHRHLMSAAAFAQERGEKRLFERALNPTREVVAPVGMMGEDVFIHVDERELERVDIVEGSASVHVERVSHTPFWTLTIQICFAATGKKERVIVNGSW